MDVIGGNSFFANLSEIKKDKKTVNKVDINIGK